MLFSNQARRTAFALLTISISLVTLCASASAQIASVQNTSVQMRKKLPTPISVTSSNDLDFLQIGENFGKQTVACRVSTFEAGTLISKKVKVRWQSFARIVGKLRKKKRNAKKAQNSRAFRRYKKSLRNAIKSGDSLGAKCFSAIKKLGVKPIPDKDKKDDVKGTGKGTPTPTATPKPSPTATIKFAGTGFTPIRINSGGPTDFLVGKYKDSKGNTWENDKYYFGVQSYFHRKTKVPGLNDQEIWMSERYGPAFSYRIPLPEKAIYVVALHMGEIFWDKAGERVFDVYIEDQKVISALDLIASVGKDVATVRLYEVKVTDGQLDVDFVALQQYAKINAIEVFGHPTQYTPLF